MRRRLLAGFVAALAVASLLAMPAGATDLVIRRGLCSPGPTHWVLSVQPAGVSGRLRVKFVVRGADQGVAWQIALSDNGHRLLPAADRTTDAAGSFRVVRSIRDRIPRDHIVVSATDSNLESCTGKVVF